MVTTPAQQGVRTTPVVGWEIEQPEYDARVARVRRELERRDLSGLVLFHPIRMAYCSGFFHYSTERPMAIVVGQEGGLAALVPHLEQDHIAAIPGVERVMIYPEYPTGGAKRHLLSRVVLLARSMIDGHEPLHASRSLRTIGGLSVRGATARLSRYLLL